jgi:branched-chain amino acid transport system ATP-binding protein
VPILEVKGLTRNFGGLTAVDQVNLEVDEREIRGIIGPNGAGKTTLFNVISGFLAPTNGRVLFRGKDVTRMPAHAKVKEGIVRTFQLTNLFMDMTAFENTSIGCHKNYREGIFSQFFHTASARGEYKRWDREARAILEFMGLDSFGETFARNLPFGHQRILGVCIALATKPALLLLDEPVAGMNPGETRMMMDLIRKIRDDGVTVLLVEHDMAAVMNLCEKISVLDYGKKIAEGSPQEIKKERAVIEAYLGSEENHPYHA